MQERLSELKIQFKKCGCLTKLASIIIEKDILFSKMHGYND